MNEFMLGETPSTPASPFAFPPIPEVQGTCELLLPHLFNELLPGTRTGLLLLGDAFSSGTASIWMIPGPWKGGEIRGGGVTVILAGSGTGAPKMYARSRFVIVIFENVGEGCRT